MIERRYLQWYNKIGYGSGDIAGNVVYAFLSTFMMFYLTDTVGMDVGIVGSLMALSKLFDGVTDLFFGMLIDKTYTRMGKARPWMMFGYIGVAVMLAAIFMIPEDWGENAQYAYFFITYTLLNGVFFTANNIAYASLTALVTKNASERVELGSFRFVFAFATSAVIQAITIGAVEAHGGGVEGWKWIAVVYAIVGLITNTISCLSVKELNVEESTDVDTNRLSVRQERYTLMDGARLLLSNQYYVMICITYLLSQLCLSTLNMSVYYMKYILGDAELVGSFSFAMNLPLIIGVIFTPVLVKHMHGMYKLNVVGYMLSVMGRIGVLAAACFRNIPLMLLFTGISALGTSPLQCDLNALIAACVEYTYLTKGKRMDGAMYSCASFGIKMGGSIGTAVSGWLLAMAGFVENAPVQTESTISMLHFLYLGVPLLTTLVIALVLGLLNVEKANRKILAERT